jgi:hypothetical protein
MVAFGLVLAVASGCYSVRKSSGGGQIEFRGVRAVNHADVDLPDGYEIEVVARDLTFPTGAAFDSDGRLYIVESGYCYGEVWTTPRLLRIETNGSSTPVATGGTNGPWTGVVWHEGLPSFGDHHTDGPAVSSEGWIYFGQGTASNTGVIGADNGNFGWLKRKPEFHDIPGQDITLAGGAVNTILAVNFDAVPQLL